MELFSYHLEQFWDPWMRMSSRWWSPLSLDFLRKLFGRLKTVRAWHKQHLHWHNIHVICSGILSGTHQSRSTNKAFVRKRFTPLRNWLLLQIPFFKTNFWITIDPFHVCGNAAKLEYRTIRFFYRSENSLCFVFQFGCIRTDVKGVYSWEALRQDFQVVTFCLITNWLINLL